VQESDVLGHATENGWLAKHIQNAERNHVWGQTSPEESALQVVASERV